MIASRVESAIDRNYTLQDLLAGIDLQRLGQGLAVLLGEDFFLMAADGALLLGERHSGPADVVPLLWDLETVGQLGTCSASCTVLKAAAGLIQLIMHSNARYHLASNMHFIAIRADYQALQEKHAALMESETRYKRLAEHLEERVQAQVETIAAAHREIYQAEKLASVGQLAAGVAHEINNPLGFIRSNLNSAKGYVEDLKAFSIMLDEASDLADVRALWSERDLGGILADFSDLLDEGMTGVDRVARIVADLKTFSNVDQAEREVADVNEIIRAVCKVIGSQMRDFAELDLDLGRLPPILCAPGHLRQALLNLVRNAGQAGTRDNKISIRSAVVGDSIEIVVRDTGCGIPDSLLPRIFEPFFSTRDVGQGVGLGLSIARDIVKAHGGRIAVESQVGLGATFTIHIPLRS